MRLVDALARSTEGTRLATQLNIVRRNAATELDHVRALFPQYTDHSVRHSDAVVGILDWLVPDDVKDKLNEWELYFLSAASYLHDIGMAEGCPGTPKGADWNKYVQERLAPEGVDANEWARELKMRFVRDNHHLRSEVYIKDHWLDLGLVASNTPAEGAIVGRIASGHRLRDLGDASQFGVVAFGNNDLIHRDLLAAYLRLADELDTTAFRTPWSEYQIAQLDDPTSRIEWAKHLSLSGVSADHGVLKISGTCHDHGIYLRLQALHTDMREKLLDLKRTIPAPYVVRDDVMVRDPLPYRDIEFDIEHVGYLPIDIKFELQDREITRLIMGERLYGDKTAFLRELLQNAVDACHEASGARPASWRPHITVSEGPDQAWISVEDNGSGMSEEIVRNYFSRVGISYYRSKDFHGSFKPIGEFGIGILSCFMVAERLGVETYREGAAPIDFDVRSVAESFVPRPGARRSPGTRVTVHVRTDLGEHIDLLARVRYFARHIDIPIEVRTPTGEITIVEDPGMRPTGSEVEEWVQDKYSFQPSVKDYCSVASGERSGSGLSVGATVLSTILGARQNGWSKPVPTIFLTQDGFAVREIKELPIPFGHAWINVDVGADRRITLTADRTRWIEDADLMAQVADEYAAIAEHVFDTGAHQSATDWWAYHREAYGQQDYKGPAYGKDVPVPAALREAYLTFARYCVVTNEGYQDLSAGDLVQSIKHVSWVSDKDGLFSELGKLRDLLPDNVILAHRASDASWAPVLEGPAGGPALASLYGARHKLVPIAGKRRHFFDAGRPTGRWRLPWGWAIFGYGQQLLDAQHPYSQMLLNTDLSKAPEFTRVAIDALFARAHYMKPEEIKDQQGKICLALKTSGLIQAVPDLPLDRMPPSHKCVYARASRRV